MCEMDVQERIFSIVLNLKQGWQCSEFFPCSASKKLPNTFGRKVIICPNVNFGRES